MNLKSIWSGNVGLKGVLLVALVSLVVGLGISGSLDWLAPSRAVNMMGESGSPEPRTAGQLPDFVALAKKMRPLLCKFNLTQVSVGRGAQQVVGKSFGEYYSFNFCWNLCFAGPVPLGP